MEAEVLARRREIAASLAHEESTLASIQDSLKSADHMTKTMESILENFGDRLGKLEEAVIPIHRQTKDLQRLQDNIENVLGAIDKVVGYHHVAKRQKDLISKGVQGQLDKYMTALSEVQKAVAFFTKNNPDSPELNRVRQLLDIGKQQMEKYFSEFIRQNSKVPAPESVYELIADSSAENTLGPRIDSSEGPRPVPIAEFDKSVQDELNRISNWMTYEAKYDSYSHHYGQIRGNILYQTLTQFKEFVRTVETSSIYANKGKALPGRKSIGRRQR